MTKDAVVPASYTIPETLKERIERIASEQDLTASQVIRRILAEHFSRVDATDQADQIPGVRSNSVAA
jgi:predicted transcriptional regulator